MASIHMYAARNNTPVLYRDVRPRVDTWLKKPPRGRTFRTPPPSRTQTPSSGMIPRKPRPRSLSPSPRTMSADRSLHSQHSLQHIDSFEEVNTNIWATRISILNFVSLINKSSVNINKSSKKVYNLTVVLLIKILTEINFLFLQNLLLKMKVFFKSFNHFIVSSN